MNVYDNRTKYGNSFYQPFNPLKMETFFTSNKEYGKHTNFYRPPLPSFDKSYQYNGNQTHFTDRKKLISNQTFEQNFLNNYPNYKQSTAFNYNHVNQIHNNTYTEPQKIQIRNLNLL